MYEELLIRGPYIRAVHHIVSRDLHQALIPKDLRI